MGREGNCLKGWGLKAMMYEFTQIFIDLYGLKVGWGETSLKGWGLRAMMSEFTWKRNFFGASVADSHTIFYELGVNS